MSAGENLYSVLFIYIAIYITEKYRNVSFFLYLSDALLASQIFVNLCFPHFPLIFIHRIRYSQALYAHTHQHAVFYATPCRCSECHALSNAHPSGPHPSTATYPNDSLRPAADGPARHDYSPAHVQYHIFTGHDQPCRAELHQCDGPSLVSDFFFFKDIKGKKWFCALFDLWFLTHSSPQTLMSGSNPMLGCSPGTLASGIPLSGLLPSGGLMSGALPAMQPAAPAGKLLCQLLPAWSDNHQ